MTFRVSVRRAVDYPLDLYYLMDVSKSLKNDLASLRSLGMALGKLSYQRCDGRKMSNEKGRCE